MENITPGRPDNINYTDYRRFRDKFYVDNDTGCWLWTAYIGDDGYGQFWLNGYRPRAHIVSYRWWVGSIPDGLQLDHLCRVRHCINPNHLEAVTPRENLLRGDTKTARNAKRIHCPSGHLLIGSNVYIRANGGRECRACRKEAKVRWRENNA